MPLWLICRIEMCEQVSKSVRQEFCWMERLDRWGYITVGFSLFAVSIIWFLKNWAGFVASVQTGPLLLNGLNLVNTSFWS